MEHLNNTREIDLIDEIVTLDPKRLSFNDANIGKFMEELSVWYDYYSSKSAKAEDLFGKAEIKYENKKAEKFLQAKGQGLSDKAAEAFSSVDSEVIVAKDATNLMKTQLKQLKEFLRSLDKAHDMAKSRGFMMQKEMDKLGCNIDDIIGAMKNKEQI